MMSLKPSFMVEEEDNCQLEETVQVAKPEVLAGVEVGDLDGV